MIADLQTLRDLEIFEGHGGRPSILRWLDTTRTNSGSKRLRARFLNPTSDPDKIIAIHGALRTIIRNRDAFRVFPTQYLIGGFENYFHWRLTAPATGRGFLFLLDASQIRVDYRRWIQVSTGVRQTAQLIEMAAEIARRTSEPEGELRELLSELQKLLSLIDLSSLPGNPPEEWYWWSILRADQLFRMDRKNEVRRVVEIIAEIDALVAMADASIDRGFVLPELMTGGASIEAAGLYYPLLTAPVSNDVEANQVRRLIFLTGPNMAGKTTYLRACGLSIFLAHLGMGVPARAFRFAPCEALITALALQDDVRAGISFFQAEAIRAQQIAGAIAQGMRVVAIVDEPFKGTNIRDAFDASRLFISRLVQCEGSIFLISSHLVELADELDVTNIGCYRFEAAEAGDILEFNYVMQAGVSQQRLGLRVLEEHGVLDVLDKFLATRNEVGASP